MREYEVLRIAASIHGREASASAEQARREVLAWAENRSGGRFPDDAWRFENFEHLAGGRNSVGVRLENEESDLWAIRADDPDKTIAGRVWTTEVVIGVMAGQRARFSVRQLVSTAEHELEVEPHTPGLVQQVAEKCGLSRGFYEIEASPLIVKSEADSDAFQEMLIDEERTFPVFVLTVAEGAAQPETPSLDVRALSRAVLGMGQVVVLPAQYTRSLTERFGKYRSVFGGGARVYLPGFNANSSPYEHRLVIGERLSTDVDRQRTSRWMRSLAASESVRRAQLGRDVLAFGAIRNATLKARQQRLRTEGASEGELLAAAQAQVDALEAASRDDAAALEYFSAEAQKAEERAEAAEAQQRAFSYRIQVLEDALKKAGQDVDADLPSPGTWTDFADWSDANLAGRVVLAPAARRAVKTAAFEDLELVARCMLWLATTYRDGRINGAEGDFVDFVLEPGVRNSACGGDEFDLSWQGRRYTADWHIKNGGNTRDPQRCLRIYYFWEPETQQVVVAELPEHRRTSAT